MTLREIYCRVDPDVIVTVKVYGHPETEVARGTICDKKFRDAIMPYIARIVVRLRTNEDGLEVVLRVA